MPDTFKPTEAQRQALACFEEAASVLEAARAWPGWDLAQTPLAFYSESGLLLNEALASARAGAVRGRGMEAGAGAIPVAGYPQWFWRPGADAAAGLRRRRAVLLLQGKPVAFLPVADAAAGSPRELQEFVADIWYHAFQAWQRSQLPAFRAPGLITLRYPVESARNNALGHMEGLILRDALRAGEPVPELNRLRLAFALVRRERRAGLPEEIIAYEQAVERVCGLAMWVRQRALEAASSPGYRCRRSFTAFSGLLQWTHADVLGREAMEALERLNRSGWGAVQRRFAYSGMGLAMLLERTRDGWRAAVLAGRTLDQLLEEDLRYDGGAGDEEVLRWAEARYGFDQILLREEECARRLRQRRRRVIEEILRGRGTLCVFDVSDLDLEREDDGPDAVEPLNEGLVLYRGPVRFTCGDTELAFSGLPVLEDRYAGLIQVRLAGVQALRIWGDDEPLGGLAAAEFSEGLSLEARGVRIAARRGTVQAIEGAVYFKLKG